jgi:hypothetical protein
MELQRQHCSAAVNEMRLPQGTQQVNPHLWTEGIAGKQYVLQEQLEIISELCRVLTSNKLLYDLHTTAD